MKFEQIVENGTLSMICGIILGILYVFTEDLPFIIGCIGLFLLSAIVRYGSQILKKLEDNP